MTLLKKLNINQYHFDKTLLSKALLLSSFGITLFLIFLREKIVKLFINFLNPLSTISFNIDSIHREVNDNKDNQPIFNDFSDTVISKANKNDNQNDENIGKDDNNDLDDYSNNLKKKSKYLGYEILLNTMSKYIDQYPKNPQFEHFLKIMWPADYDILIKSKQKIDGFSRNYNDWEDIFNLMIPNY